MRFLKSLLQAMLGNVQQKLEPIAGDAEDAFPNPKQRPKKLKQHKAHQTNASSSQLLYFNTSNNPSSGAGFGLSACQNCPGPATGVQLSVERVCHRHWSAGGGGCGGPKLQQHWDVAGKRFGCGTGVHLSLNIRVPAVPQKHPKPPNRSQRSCPANR